MNMQMKEMRLPKIMLIVDQVGKYEDSTIVVCDTARFGIDLIQDIHRANIAIDYFQLRWMYHEIALSK